MSSVKCSGTFKTVKRIFFLQVTQYLLSITKRAFTRVVFVFISCQCKKLQKIVWNSWVFKSPKQNRLFILLPLSCFILESNVSPWAQQSAPYHWINLCFKIGKYFQMPIKRKYHPLIPVRFIEIRDRFRAYGCGGNFGWGGWGGCHGLLW